MWHEDFESRKPDVGATLANLFCSQEYVLNQLRHVLKGFSNFVLPWSLNA